MRSHLKKKHFKQFMCLNTFKKFLLGLMSRLLEKLICVTSLDTVYFLLEHSNIPAIIDNKTANEPANKHKIGNKDKETSSLKSVLGSSSLKLISMWTVLE